MNITKVTKLEERAVRAPDPLPAEAGKEESTKLAVKVEFMVEETKTPDLISFDPESVMKGIVMATILGPPKGRVPRGR